MDLRSLQKPLKDQYRADPTASRITLRAKGTQTDAPVSCSVDIGRAIYQAEAHKGVGGAGAGACSGDLLARCSRRMRANHLSDGSRRHGHSIRTHRNHSRRRFGSPRHTRYFKGRPSRLRKHPPEFRHRRFQRNSRPAPRPARKNRTILRRYANSPTPTQTPNHLAQSLLSHPLAFQWHRHSCLCVFLTASTKIRLGHHPAQANRPSALEPFTSKTPPHAAPHFPSTPAAIRDRRN